MSGQSHYELAMREARRMGRSGSRKKSSRIICHHLLQMLADDAPELETKRRATARLREGGRQGSLLLEHEGTHPPG